MQSEQLSAIAGIALSLAFSYIPGLRGWFDTLTSQYKQAVMGIALILTAGSVFALTCGGIIQTSIPCSQSGAVGLVWMLVQALIANQATYVGTRHLSGRQ